jgi:hypothetical protein
MNQQPQTPHQEIRLRRMELQRQESEARSIPYISFILTHVALVLFLIAAFVIDHLISDTTIGLVVKISMCVIAVLFLASEWVYAIITSRRWKKNIAALLQLEEEQRATNEQEQQRHYENALAVEQLRNRALQYNLRNRRDQRTPMQSAPPSGPFGRSQPGYPSQPGYANQPDYTNYTSDNPRSQANPNTDPFNRSQAPSNPQWNTNSQFDFTRSFDEWNVNPNVNPYRNPNDEPPTSQSPWS